MNDGQASYSALSPDDQAAVSVWIEGFADRLGMRGPAALGESLSAASPHVRFALLTQLLPLLIEAYRRQHRVTPTLHELKLAHPDLAGDIAAAYPQLPPAYRLPEELHGYRVTRVVGEGGQAVVLRAQDDVHSTVAIKLSTSPQHNELLLRERRILGECDHPGIVPVIGSGVHDGAAYFVMPYLKGKTLADRYATHRPGADEAARVIVELCGIVEHLHGLGVLHRDIKPANVWIDDHGTVKLIDLGMAIERNRWGQPVSELREFHGTPAFMSPQQAAADGERDGELSDIFSIGATLYWLGTGSAPFEGGTQGSVVRKAAAGRFDRDQLSVVSRWPASLVRTCMLAMDDDPSRRHRSPSDLATAVGAAQFAQPAPLWTAAAWVAGVTTVLVVCWLAATDKLQPFFATAATATVQEPSDDTQPEVLAVPEENETAPLPDEIPSDATGGRVDDRKDQPPPAQPKRDTSPQDPLVPPSNLPTPPAGMKYIPVQTLLYAPGKPPDIRWRLSEIPNSKVAPSILSPDLSDYARVKKAKDWISDLPPNTQLGELIGRRFHPTKLSRIREAITAIRIPGAYGRYGDRTILFGDQPDSFWNVSTERIRDNLLRPLRQVDLAEYAYDSKGSAGAIPVDKPYIEISPGVSSFHLTVYFLDGSSLEKQLVSNLDRSVAIELSSDHPLTPRAKLFLFRERSIVSDSVAKYLTKPLDPSDPNRDYLLRTRVGFWCPIIPRYPRRAASTRRETVEPPTRIVPGTYYVHHMTSKGRTTRVNGYKVTREKLSELADLAASFEQQVRTQYFDANGRRRTP